MHSIDINCDMGESFGNWKMGNDEALMPFISSANIACGFHAGDPQVMLHTVRLAQRHGVAIGAHPGYPDLQGFGRRSLQMSLHEIFAMVVYQIGALQAIAKTEGGQVRHVKPHGALYNDAAKNRQIAETIASAVRSVDPDLILYGLSGSESIAAAKAIGLRTCSEVFADRTYQDDGSLTPRSQANALIENDEDALRQVLQMVENQTVTSVSGKTVPLEAETICLHGDGAHAVSFAQTIFKKFQEKGILIKCP